ncbi:hypothetical protein GIB67_039756 [Kingdonia uniflora]|uniref:F-box domain-containing protein n=1 Tax=Kingdonia uniflora TaxID=39325 RepID=A0A7J7MPX7_9MAGN|nr:hypothetical protein GIB67_039756 [Kingdonia uniflora]
MESNIMEIGVGSEQKSRRVVDLPWDIICDILSRLPIETLMCFTSISKVFDALTKDRDFIQMQLSRAKPPIILKNDDSPRSLYLRDEGEMDFEWKCIEIPTKTANKRSIEILGSYNGLLLLQEVFPLFFEGNTPASKKWGFDDKCLIGLQKEEQTHVDSAYKLYPNPTIEASAIPAIVVSCRTMFDQVNATFQKGMVEHTAVAQRQFESSPSQLVLSLKDTINSASSMTQTLTGELADGQRKLLALAVAKANSNAVNPLVKQLSNGPLGGLHDMSTMLEISLSTISKRLPLPWFNPVISASNHRLEDCLMVKILGGTV